MANLTRERSREMLLCAGILSRSNIMREQCLILRQVICFWQSFRIKHNWRVLRWVAPPLPFSFSVYLRRLCCASVLCARSSVHESCVHAKNIAHIQYLKCQSMLTFIYDITKQASRRPRCVLSETSETYVYTYTQHSTQDGAAIFTSPRVTYANEIFVKTCTHVFV